MIAIETKYLPATNTKPSRIVANGNGNRIIVDYESGLNIAQAHAVAAKALCHKMAWSGTLVSGATNKGYVFCFDQSDKF